MKRPPFTRLQIALLLVRSGLGVVFLWASWDKIAHPDEFAAIIMNYDILPAAAVNMTALVLPWIELTCGLLLLTGRLVPGAALTIDALLVVFILATTFNLYRGLDINCGCFSVAPGTGNKTILNMVRDGLLLAAGTWLLICTVSGANRGALAAPGGGPANAG